MTSLAQDAADRLRALPNVDVYGPTERSGVVSFNIKSINHHDVSMILDDAKICTRSGHHCAMPAHRFLGVDGTVRASFAMYNTLEEVDMLIDAVESIAMGLL